MIDSLTSFNAVNLAFVFLLLSPSISFSFQISIRRNSHNLSLTPSHVLFSQTGENKILNNINVQQHQHQHLQGKKQDQEEEQVKQHHHFTDEEEEEMRQKLAWAKHTVLTIAASIMCVPPDVLTTPPMVDPKPPSTPSERLHRKKINDILQKGYPNALDGFEISKEEIELINETNNSYGSGHSPATYGEITTLGARQLFHYMQSYKENDLSNDKENDFIHFIDLGSGNGKLVVQAYLEIPNLNKAEGIELSPARHEIANKSWDDIREEANRLHYESMELSNIAMEQRDEETQLNLVQGNLFEMDISTATHIYVASLCFTEEMMNQLSLKIIEEGSDQLQCIATLKAFPTEFEMISGFNKKAQYVEMSWTKPRGMGGIVYFYSKI